MVAITKFSKHEANSCEAQEGQQLAIVVLLVERLIAPSGIAPPLLLRPMACGIENV